MMIMNSNGESNGRQSTNLAPLMEERRNSNDIDDISLQYEDGAVKTPTSSLQLMDNKDQIVSTIAQETSNEWEQYTTSSVKNDSNWTSYRRNDRTPLNTPRTPQLVALQLRSNGGQQNHEKSTVMPSESFFDSLLKTVETIKTKVFGHYQRFRMAVDDVVKWFIPEKYHHYQVVTLFSKTISTLCIISLCNTAIIVLLPIGFILSLITFPFWSVSLLFFISRLFWRQCSEVFPWSTEFLSSSNLHGNYSPEQLSRLGLMNGRHNQHPNAAYHRSSRYSSLPTELRKYK